MWMCVEGVLTNRGLAHVVCLLSPSCDQVGMRESHVTCPPPLSYEEHMYVYTSDAIGTSHSTENKQMPHH